jgi:hypothetical protein
MDNILLELDAIGVSIEQATADKNKAKGAKESIVSNIKKSYGVETKEEIEAEIDDMDRRLNNLGVKIESKFKDLQENYSWEE